ncbi:hypothetical protein PPYR_06928 [Photinus pyralis]|uniref:Transient receptor ion channel domain-containing protein n=1 Tax=Photinus pyralis TaxID=7054 RepID=A0A5N4APA8_PHOPY|nr:transient-receptor-potential-like protein [Photinus pyralis]KAB0799048.1 hypothetical protein PPYR_06928 [Photinus pyralis]
MDETTIDIDGAPEKSVLKTNLPKPLTMEEKKYLLAVERGDMANVRRMLQKAHRHRYIDVDCVDSLGRSSLTIAIDGENLEMVELLVIMGVKTRDALLHAINAEFVEAVELLLEHEELIHQEGEPYSWQTVNLSTATFTPDLTPLMLAAHKNNYEILKILLDRGATIPMPHDIKCGCDDCIKESKEDSLRQALSRLNEYKALASPSLIALSSSDPILTAFQLSWELRNLAFGEPECRAEYLELRRQCQQFAVDLLHQSRSSEELAIILNYDPESPPYEAGDHMKLARLELAITYKQKKFVAHSNIQQLLAALWYEGVPGFRRMTTPEKLIIILRTALFFPLYCTLYMLAPQTGTGKLMRKPFMKFLIHASSYLFFLFILILVSQRAEDLLIEFFGTESMKTERFEKQRGNPPAILEYVVLIYVIGYIYEETYEIYAEGMQSYLRNLWNSIDFTRNFLYCMVFVLRVAAYLQQKNEIEKDPSTAYIPRENWNAFDPQLIAEGLFAAANIFSALKLVHLFSINPHLGPLQISLGRMVIDIVKFFFIYSLVLFAFACGLNQLLWYFSNLEKKKCYSLPNGEPDWENQSDACMKWRSFANVFEASQSLFWASFGMVDLENFELMGIKTYTRFWGLLMFGSYSVINVIVLLNLLIAMMSNSYAMIDEHSDTEWKFARTKLWLSYFEEGNTLPPPFNVFPTMKTLAKAFKLRRKDKERNLSTNSRNREEKERDYRYTSIMRALVWRYVSSMHKKMEEDAVTEDDINEVKGDISAFRYDLLEVLSKNGMDISSVETKEKAVLGKKMKMWERQLMKDFKVAPIVTEEEADQLIYESPPANEDPLARFRRIAKLAVLTSNLHKWKQVVTGVCLASQIGHCSSKDSFRKQQNLLKAMEEVQRIVTRSPAPTSRPPTPIDLPDTTGQSIMEILKDMNPKGNPKISKKFDMFKLSKTPLQPKVVVSQPSIALSPPSPKKESSLAADDVPDFIQLESPKSPSVKSLRSNIFSGQTILEEESEIIKSPDLKTRPPIVIVTTEEPTTSDQEPETLPESTTPEQPVSTVESEEETVQDAYKESAELIAETKDTLIEEIKLTTAAAEDTLLVPIPVEMSLTTAELKPDEKELQVSDRSDMEDEKEETSKPEDNSTIEDVTCIKEDTEVSEQGIAETDDATKPSPVEQSAESVPIEPETSATKEDKEQVNAEEISPTKTPSPPSEETTEESPTGKSKSRKAQAPPLPEAKPPEESKKASSTEGKDAIGVISPDSAQTAAKSPLTSRNITRIGDTKPRKQPRTGWL